MRATTYTPYGSAYERVLAALGTAGCRVLRSGDRARAQCPSHHSRRLSLAVHNGDGRAHLTCYAGCDDEAVLDAIGLDVRDLFDADAPPAYRYIAPTTIERTPWDDAMARIGLTPPYPPIEHVLDRMWQEQQRVRREAGDA